MRLKLAATMAALGMAGLLGVLCAAPQRAGAQDRDYRDSREADRWNWSGSVESGRTVYVRNLNGPIRVEPTSGTTVEISAVKRVRRDGRAADVKITAEQRSNHGDVVVCARWTESTRCDEDGYSTQWRDGWWPWGDNRRGNDVSVEFTVRIPKGVRITSSSVNGGIEIEGVESEVNASTVNGSVTARSNGGPVRARTVNGSLTVRTTTLGTGTLDYETVNGQITLEIPDNSSADVEIRTVNGSISTDFPLTIEGKFSNHRVRGTIGKGGQLLKLTTVNGSIHLRKA
jgi:hypothetical protein